MHGNLANDEHGTTNANVKSDAEKSIDVKSDADWFYQVVSSLLVPPKQGAQLFHLTGLGDERLCQKYAAGHVKPSAYFFRRLLWHPNGRPWLCGAMDGCTEQWWIDEQRAVSTLRAIEGVK